MVLGIFRRDDRRPFALYGAIVAQARQPALYAALRVPDTVDGRFDMVVLHLVLAVRRLRGAAAMEQQAVFDLFIADMDRSLREMGVGDLTVPKRIKKMAEAFYGRLEAYGTALDAGDRAALAQAIDRNVFPDAGDPAAAAALAAYALTAEQALAAQPIEDIVAGRIGYPAPADFAEEDAR
jgi:cytochrome b pre-mRNA-processing protein 3